ncbi:MAG TPA: PAS domain-containing protein, partial [Bryobacteraceae bacterium]|nr:PAS domain-containing protein [Bryobacteraceae bacterium]
MIIQNSSEFAGASAKFNPSEARLRLIIDSIPVIAWCALAGSSGEFWNQRWHDYTGLPIEGARGGDWRSAIHPEDLDWIENKWCADLASGHAGEVEGRLRRFDGEYRWFSFRYEPLREEASNIVNWYGTITDIDDLKRAQEALSANEQSLRLIIDSIPGLVATMNATGKVELVNRHSLKHLGRTSEESNEWALGNAVHADDLPDLTEALKRAVETAEPLEHEQRLRRADGVYRWYQFRGLPQRDADGRIVRWYILATDIEDLKRAEQKLRESEEEFQRIADFVAQAIVVLSADGNVAYVNRVTLQKTGLTLEEVKAQGCYSSFRDRIVGLAESLPFHPGDVVKVRGGYFSSAFHPEDVENLWAKRCAGLSRGEPFELEIRSKRPGGQYQWVLLQYNPFRDDQGNIVRWYVTGTDIQRQKTEQERLRNENVALREEIESSMFEEIVGSSEPMR